MLIQTTKPDEREEVISLLGDENLLKFSPFNNPFLEEDFNKLYYKKMDGLTLSLRIESKTLIGIVDVEFHDRRAIIQYYLDRKFWEKVMQVMH